MICKSSGFTFHIQPLLIPQTFTPWTCEMIGRLFVRVRSVRFVAFVSLMYNEKTGKLWTDYWCVYCAIYSVLYIVCSILFKRNWVCLAWGHDCLRLGLEVSHMIDCKIFRPCSNNISIFFIFLFLPAYITSKLVWCLVDFTDIIKCRCEANSLAIKWRIYSVWINK